MDDRARPAVRAAIEEAWRAPRLGAVNWRGLWTQFFTRGLLRFLRAGYETLGAPVVSSMLFLAVFAVAAPESRADGLTTLQFVAPGIVIFSLSHTAFDFSAMMLVYDKMERMIEDLLVAPLSALEMLTGQVLAACASALCVGLLVGLLASPVAGFSLHSPLAVIGFGLGAAMLFALLGTLVGLWADRWDHYAAAEGFIIFPLTILSGVFFGLGNLPPEFRWVLEVNPLFHAVDGFRYGLTGYSESDPLVGALFLLATNLALWLLLWRLMFTGYKLRA